MIPSYTRWKLKYFIPFPILILECEPNTLRVKFKKYKIASREGHDFGAVEDKVSSALNMSRACVARLM